MSQAAVLSVSTKYYISSVNEEMDVNIEELADTDIDGNGEVNVNLEELSFWYDPSTAHEEISEEVLDMMLATRDKLFVHLTVGETFLFMMDVDTYDMLVLANENESFL